jgi:ABC-type branched-subunit amino acid transport system substrate-binding protein
MLNAGDIVKKQIADYASFVPSTLLFPGLLYMTPELATPAIRVTQNQFVEAFSSQSAAATVPGAFAYEPARVAIEAFRHVGTKATAKQLRDYIETIKNFPSINGLMNFTDGSQRGSSVTGVVIVRWDNPNQSFVPVSKPGGLLR